MRTAHLLTISQWGSGPEGGVWSQGVPGPGGMVSQHALRQTPLWTEFLTHSSENITLPQTSFVGGNDNIANFM